MRLKAIILMVMVAATAIFTATPAEAGPPRDCNTGDFPDPCPVLYVFCQTKPGAVICRD